MDQGFRALGQVSRNIFSTGARGFIGLALIVRSGIASAKGSQWRGFPLRHFVIAHFRVR